MGNRPEICTCTPEYPDEPACDVHGYFAGAPPMSDRHCDFIGCVEHIDGMHVDHVGDAIVHVDCDMCRPPVGLTCACGHNRAEKHNEVGCYAADDRSPLNPCQCDRPFGQDVGLREDEREALGSIRIAQGDLDAYGATWRVAEVVEKLIAARVAEAGARALMDAADNGPSSTPTDELWRMWLRDRARGLGGAS